MKRLYILILIATFSALIGCKESDVDISVSATSEVSSSTASTTQISSAVTEVTTFPEIDYPIEYNESIIYYDYVWTMDCVIENEEDFPFKNALVEIESSFSDIILDLAWDKEQLFEYLGYDGDVVIPIFDYAIVDDFDGDGKKEGFIVIKAMDGISMLQTRVLYFVDSDGHTTDIEAQPLFEFEGMFIYPNEKHLSFSSNYGTGLSYYARIYGYNGNTVQLLDSINTTGYEKDGCFVMSSPRVGSAAETVPIYMYWDSENFQYIKVSPAEIPVDVFKYNFGGYSRSETLEKEFGMKLTKVASIANRIYVLEFQDAKGDLYISNQIKTNGTFENFKYSYPLFRFDVEYLCQDNPPLIIDFEKAMTAALD